MQCIVLASGSSGNSTYLESDGYAILIDAGLSGKETLRRLHAAGVDPSRIQAIFLTHEHGDHIRGAAPLAQKLGIPMYGTAGTLGGIPVTTRNKGVERRKITHYNSLSLNHLTITPFRTSHDAHDPCGYCIEENSGVVSVCTDTGIITERTFGYLKKSDLLLLESNYCPDMLTNNPFYPEHLKRRIRSDQGHLSNDDAAQILQSLACDLSAVILSHRSKENNTQERAMQTAQNVLHLRKNEITLLLAKRKEEEPDAFVNYRL